VRTIEANVLSPGTQELAIAIEDDHRVRPAGEDIDVVLAVHGDGGRFAESDAGRQFAPLFQHAITVLAFSEDDRLSRPGGGRTEQGARAREHPRAQHPRTCGHAAEKAAALHIA